MFEQTEATFREDQVVLELQQRRLLQSPDRPRVDILSDAGGNMARRRLAELMKAEAPKEIATA